MLLLFQSSGWCVQSPSIPVKYFTDRSKVVVLLCYFCLVLLCFHARLFVDALWSPAGKGLTSWLSFVMSICDVTFPLVSWVRCGAWLYWFLIFALFLTLIGNQTCNCYKSNKTNHFYTPVPQKKETYQNMPHILISSFKWTKSEIYKIFYW